MDVEEKLSCKNDQARRALVFARTDLNGIDYVEVDAANHHNLHVYFIRPVKPLNPLNPLDPNDEYGLSTNLTPITISGGTRIVGIKVVMSARQPDGWLLMTVDMPGDYSTYTLTIDIPGLDRRFKQVDFSFMASCPSDFDCRPAAVCPPPQLTPFPLDYQAKDYASFRRMLLDLLPQLNPNAIERNVADLSIVVTELLAYTADGLSYFQDAVPNEAYLATARQRISARRLAKLIDYKMHDGRNAWAYVFVEVTAPFALPQSSKLVSHITAPLRGDAKPPAVVVKDLQVTADALETDPALASAVVFETTFDINLDPKNNQIFIHTWGDDECCMASGTTEAFLYMIKSDNTADVPVLKKGDFLLFEELVGPTTGLPADANPLHRQVVQIDEDPQPDSDPLFSNITVDGIPQKILPLQPVLPLLRVRWRIQDALTFPICLSARVDDNVVHGVTVCRGNIVLADHGITTEEIITPEGPVTDPNFGLTLTRGPLTMQAQSRTELTGDVRSAKPAVLLTISFPTEDEAWAPLDDLLESSPFDQNFVAEINNFGQCQARFGDDEYAKSVLGAIKFKAVYRIGNGTKGNLGAEALAHLALPSAAPISVVRNPLAAIGGVEPESIAEVQQWAPQAFRVEQFRAVTEGDYAVIAKKLPQVQSAVANFRWTGSWYTVFVGVQPSSTTDLIRKSNGITLLSDTLRKTVFQFLTTYRQTGYDLEIRPPQFLPLEINLTVCTAPDYFRGDVEQAVLDRLSSRILADGTTGLFYPGNWVFGQSLYLSQIYAAVQAVQGVDSLEITLFREFGRPDNGELLRGVMSAGPWQIVQLDNDPSFMEHGVLRVSMLGGKS